MFCKKPLLEVKTLYFPKEDFAASSIATVIALLALTIFKKNDLIEQY